MSEETAASPARDERVAIEHAIDRLAERFPTVDRARVEQIVDEELHRLDGGRVRDFIPVLVEHEAKERLRAFLEKRAGKVALAKRDGDR